MRNFLRCLRYSWPYRYRLAVSICAAMVVAVLWSINLAAIYPVLKILGTNKNLQQWVDEEIEDHQKELDSPERKVKLETLKAQLKLIEANPDQPDRENVERRITRDIAKLEGELSYYGNWVYRYQLLKSQVIRLLPHDRFETLLWIVGAVIVGVIVKGIFEFVQESLVGSVMNLTLFDLRNRFFRVSIHQDVRQLSSTGTTELMARFTNDMEQVGGGIKIVYGRMIAEPLKGLACLIAACYISWQLTLVFFLLVPLALITLMRVSKMMRRAARRLLERMSAIYKIVRETFDSVRAVKGYTREAYERRRFHQATTDYYHKAMRVINIDAFANPLIELLGVMAVSLALAAGTYLVVTGNTHIYGMRMTPHPLTFPTLIQLYAFLAAIADPVRKLSSVYTKLQGGEAAANRIFELFDRVPAVSANALGHRLNGVHQGIEFRNIGFSYNPVADVPTLDGVSLNIKPGETIAFVGPNGCGKTTLLGLLPRFYDPDHGAVFIDGINIRTAHLRTLRRQIGIVTQDTQLFDDTVFANIAYGKKGASRDEVIVAAKQASAHDFIERLPAGYDTQMGEVGNRFSGGEKQRIALARAILRDPAILILDEFNSQLDPESEARIHTALKGFIRGRITFVITHRLNTLELADRIVVMEGGQLIDVGTHPELHARCELYQRLCDSSQFRVAA